jgi:hypothetical protein
MPVVQKIPSIEENFVTFQPIFSVCPNTPRPRGGKGEELRGGV